MPPSAIRHRLWEIAVALRNEPRVRSLTPEWLRGWVAACLAIDETIQVDADLWAHRRAAERQAAIEPVGDPTLLSLITPVWNTPLPFMRELADGVLEQARRQPLEWVVLDNGSTKPELVEYLDQDLSRREHVTFLRSAENLGIIQGTRLCLERAANRYVLPVDHDDRLYPDAAAVMARAICDAGYPALLYSDEDKLLDGVLSRPFFKPDWDPVLFLDQCFTAHFCAIDRELALDLGAYTDPACEASPDWDCFMRFALVGHIPVHVPEVVYSWRMHRESTALNMDSKPYVESSHRAVLGRRLQALPTGEHFSIDQSPLFLGTPDWWLRRRHERARPLALVTLVRSEAAAGETAAGAAAAERGASAAADYPIDTRITLQQDAHAGHLLAAIGDVAAKDGLVAVASADLDVIDCEWPWEALGLFETHDAAGIVGGRCLDHNGLILDAGRCFGFGTGCGSPDAGRSLDDRGYGLWLWKRHCVSAVSSAFSVYRAPFLRDFLVEGCPAAAPLRELGPWAGAYAARTGWRVVYSPFILSKLHRGAQRDDTPRAMAAFLAANADLIPDTRYYPRMFGLDLATNHRPVGETTRLRHVDAILRAAERSAAAGDLRST